MSELDKLPEADKKALHNILGAMAPLAESAPAGILGMPTEAPADAIELNDSQKEALGWYSQVHGASWRADLHSAWESGQYSPDVNDNLRNMLEEIKTLCSPGQGVEGLKLEPGSEIPHHTGIKYGVGVDEDIPPETTPSETPPAATPETLPAVPSEPAVPTSPSTPVVPSTPAAVPTLAMSTAEWDPVIRTAVDQGAEAAIDAVVAKQGESRRRRK